MKKIKIYAYLISILFTLNLYAQDSDRPGAFDFITDVPNTLNSAWDMSFNTKNETLYAWGAVFLSTGILYHYDEKILLEFQRFGKKLGIARKDHTKSFIKIGDTNIFRGPTDFGSALYFLGDGWTHGFIGLGFLTSGLITNSTRAIKTGSQIFNGMIASTIINQTAKRSFGRQSPYRRTVKRGRWRPFPSFNTYNNDISAYDAMPTGHLMVTTMTFTVIDENYPEQRYWLRPLAFTWGTLLGFQMVNNGVHWISDYPLGIMMGYVFGKVAANKNNTKNKKNKITLLPIFSPGEFEHVYGLVGSYNF